MKMEHDHVERLTFLLVWFHGGDKFVQVEESFLAIL